MKVKLQKLPNRILYSGKVINWLFTCLVSTCFVARFTTYPTKNIGPWGPELIWQLATKYKMSRHQRHLQYVIMTNEKWGWGSVSLACMWAKKCKMYFFLKIHNFKNIICRYIIFSLWVTPVQIHNWAEYEGSKLNHVNRRATLRILLKRLPFQKYMSHWSNISCAYTRDICTCICKIRSFYEQ